MSNDPLDGLLGSLFGGRGGFGKILQDLLGGGMSGSGGASGKVNNIPMPGTPPGAIPAPGQPAQPQPGQMPEPGQPGASARPMPAGPSQGPHPSAPPSRQPSVPQAQQTQPGMSQTQSGASTRPGTFSDLLERLRNAGLGDQVDSWVSGGKQNASITPKQVNEALGPQQVQELAKTAGVSPGEVSKDLAKALPEVVNELTPKGQMPSQSEVQTNLNRLIG